ncbi:ArsR/SmtB family transcription factor [Fodinicola acaciae]|uniref:ArsR/SmtB family transcription factor n=1 Tax=Fodinicola acaciae TaxID=2681555 RepID=UPI0013D83654|nr:metalloregulator ArsR/SmtB family transcription factor [Fodinicola acaciae]
MAQIFRALADPTRQRLLDRLHADNGQTLSALSRDLGMTRQGVTQHLAVLEEVGLVTAVRRGREKLHYLNPVPLHDIHRRWIAKFEIPDLDALNSVRSDLEGPSTMDKPSVVYVTYIATTPEKLWNALTDPETTEKYWGHRNVSGWRKGDSWEHQRTDGGNDIVGTILEIDPPRRLAHSWAGVNSQDKVSRVTFDLEPAGDLVKLTVQHHDLPEEELADTTDGWQAVLSSLKSLLETGKPLDFGW